MMAGDPNLVTIQGRLTRDPELRTTRSGLSVVVLGIASSGRRFDPVSKQYSDGPTVFWNCEAWRDLAEHIATSFAKGSQVVALARAKTDSYRNKEGVMVTKLVWELDDLAASTRNATLAITRTQRASGFRPSPQGASPGDPVPVDPFAGMDDEF